MYFPYLGAVAVIFGVFTLTDGDRLVLTEPITVEPNDMCTADLSPGVPCHPDLPDLERRFHHSADGCRPFMFEGCEANINNYISPIDCIRFCQTFQNMPLWTDITFIAAHDVEGNSDQLLSQHFLRDLEERMAEFCGGIEPANIIGAWSAHGLEHEINMGFRIASEARLTPAEATQAFLINLDNGYVDWVYNPQDGGDLIMLVAVPSQRTVDHFTERSTTTDNKLILMASIFAFIFAIIALCCVGCLVNIMRKLKGRIRAMHKEISERPLKKLSVTRPRDSQMSNTSTERSSQISIISRPSNFSASSID